MPRCRDCGSPIRFLKLESGKPIPVDPATDERGNVASASPFRTGRVISKDRPLTEGEHPFMPHRATCSGAPRPKGPSKPRPNPLF